MHGHIKTFQRLTIESHVAPSGVSHLQDTNKYTAGYALFSIMLKLLPLDLLNEVVPQCLKYNGLYTVSAWISWIT